MLSEALSRLTSAIGLLDQAEAPAHIAAHVDLAVHQLQEAIDNIRLAADFGQIDTNADPH